MDRMYSTGAQLKGRAREGLMGRYGIVICCEAIVGIINALILIVSFSTVSYSDSVGMAVGFGIRFIFGLISSVFSLGLCCIYLKTLTGGKAEVFDLFCGFRNGADKVIKARIMVGVLSFMWYIPLMLVSAVSESLKSPVGMLVTGVVSLISVAGSLSVALAFSQVPFILLDYPDMNAAQAMSRSAGIMRGKRLRLLLLQLSFIPYLIPGILSLGMAFVWILPYYNAVRAEFYLDVA